MLYDKRWDAKIETDPVLKILVDARKLIEAETNWCQQYDEDRIGEDGKPFIAICAVHALQRAMGEGVDRAINSQAFRALGRAVGVDGDGPDIGRWNDSHSHADVLAAFDRAIAERHRV